MTKLYRAVDKMNGKDSLFMINELGVNISSWFDFQPETENIKSCKNVEHNVPYRTIEEFKKRAINPVLIAEW